MPRSPHSCLSAITTQVPRRRGVQTQLVPRREKPMDIVTLGIDHVKDVLYYSV